ncbi:MAG: sensor histidine kinase, partial [Anaerolineae bacterium]
DDLLQLARIKGAAGERRPEPVDVARILEGAESLFRPEATQRGIALSVAADACPPVQAIPEHVRLVWNNLISNAIKYTPPGGEVRVSLSTDGGNVVGRVEDTGIGMSPEEQKQLFREFYRSERAKALQTRGTGLGLAIVKRVLDTYGATIEVRSVVGQGSAFTFRWPLGTPGG